jgi:hypothetical protein
VSGYELKAMMVETCESVLTWWYHWQRSEMVRSSALFSEEDFLAACRVLWREATAKESAE